MLKKLHQLSLHVANLLDNQNLEMQVKSTEQFRASKHHKPAN